MQSTREVAGKAMMAAFCGLLVLKLAVNYQLSVINGRYSAPKPEPQTAVADNLPAMVPPTVEERRETSFLPAAPGQGRPDTQVAAAAPQEPPTVQLSPEEIARLTPSGCLPGRKVSPPHAADIYLTKQAREFTADIGDVLTVDSQNPATGDRCNVIGKTYAGADVFGTIALADIAPADVVKAQIDARTYNQVKAVTFPNLFMTLVNDIQVRAPSLGVEAADFDPALHLAASFIEHCSEISQEQYEAARREMALLRTDTPFMAKYRDCAWRGLGTPINGVGRNLLVVIQLKTARSPYNVIVQFSSLKEDAPIGTRTIDEGLMAYFDRYGIGHYRF